MQLVEIENDLIMLQAFPHHTGEVNSFALF